MSMSDDLIVVIIDGLRVMNVAILLATLVILARPAYRSLTSRVEKGDLLWALFWADALNRTWFVGRSIHFADQTYVAFEAEILALCYLFAILIQALVIRAYQWGRK